MRGRSGERPEPFDAGTVAGLTLGQDRGRGGLDVREAWREGAITFKGITTSGFPNLFMLYGPNTNLAHSSILYMLESQFRYLLNALRAMREHGLATLEVRREVQAGFNESVQQGLEGSVWNAGRCASWYLDANGEAHSDGSPLARRL